MAIVKKRKASLSKNELYNLATEYHQLSKMQKELEKRKKEISDILKNNAELVGTADANGSYYVDEFPIVFGKMAKHSVKLNEEKAREYFSKIGVLESVLSTKEYVDEAKIEKLLETEVIKTDDLSNFMVDNVSYSVYVAEKKEEPKEEKNQGQEVEVPTTKVLKKPR